MSDTQDVFEHQFNTAESFRRSQEEHGIIDYVDLDLRGMDVDTRVSLKGIMALLNRIILYFASGPGDYLRRVDHGNEFGFIYNSPMNTTTQFRILATASSIMRRLFPEMVVRDIKVTAKKTGTNKEIRGWSMYMVLRHSSMDQDIALNVPMGDDNQLPSPREFITIG